jgi:hypothetical protein
VDPETLDFGNVVVGDQAQAELTLSNTGSATVYLASLTAGRGSFSVGSPGTWDLATGELTTAIVTFSPQERDLFSGTLEIQLDDAPDGPITLPLSGQGISPELQISPGQAEFSEVGIGCEETLTLTLSNIGTSDLRVDGIARDSASLELQLDTQEDLYGPLPWVLSPSESAFLALVYSPLDVYEDVLYITVTSDDPNQPTLMATATGSVGSADACD